MRGLLWFGSRQGLCAWHRVSETAARHRVDGAIRHDRRRHARHCRGERQDRLVDGRPLTDAGHAVGRRGRELTRSVRSSRSGQQREVCEDAELVRGVDEHLELVPIAPRAIDGPRVRVARRLDHGFVGRCNVWHLRDCHVEAPNEASDGRRGPVERSRRERGLDREEHARAKVDRAEGDAAVLMHQIQ